ncbi:MAG: transaldolase [Gloeobacterales cyanobacterium]
MTDTPLLKLQDYGQSVWLDYLRRNLVTSGELAQKIEQDGLRGLTSNPAIFKEAIVGSADYDDAIRTLTAQGLTEDAIYETMAVEDIQGAADAFRPLYDRLDGKDGFVSLEVSPHLARDTAGTVAEAKHLWQKVNRPNLMIKVPGTPEGLPAIQELIGEGINVNVTLLFSREAYKACAEAYLSGLEAHLAKGGNLSRVASVASFFLSRIDSSIDAKLEALIAKTTDPAKLEKLQGLMGSLAIANAKLAYQDYKALFTSERFKVLAQAGAHPQRLLWASTGTKNPHYRDVRYVEELVGPNTVNTMPVATLNACADHCELRSSLEENLEQAQKLLTDLEAVGISLDQVTADLLVDGLIKFTGPFDELLQSIRNKRALVAST